MWRIADYAKVAAVICCLGVILGSGTSVAAEDGTVVAQVCQPGATGQLTITAPDSDTVVRKAAVNLAGDVEQINQVEAYVDGTLSKVTAIPIGQTTFSMTVAIPAGTHTLEVRGNNICSGEEMRDDVVVTYEIPSSPSAPTRPSVGSETPTVTNPSPGNGGVVVSNPNPSPDTDPDEPNWLEQLFNWLSGRGFAGWVVQVTDSDMTASRMPVDGFRVLAFVAGLVMMLGASPLARQLSSFGTATWSDNRQRVARYSVRGVGICLIVLSLLFWL